ncbi:hypothetical protein MKEN_00400000 [Mycena kentingensis (nom. inval.)]|nr:hypothetical protein MKEN_00400000 [Mycena kentingensis (nom. inval.)]
MPATQRGRTSATNTDAEAYIRTAVLASLFSILLLCALLLLAAFVVDWRRARRRRPAWEVGGGGKQMRIGVVLDEDEDDGYERGPRGGTGGERDSNATAIRLSAVLPSPYPFDMVFRPNAAAAAAGRGGRALPGHAVAVDEATTPTLAMEDRGRMSAPRAQRTKLTPKTGVTPLDVRAAQMRVEDVNVLLVSR